MPEPGYTEPVPKRHGAARFRKTAVLEPAGHQLTAPAAVAIFRFPFVGCRCARTFPLPWQHRAGVQNRHRDTKPREEAMGQTLFEKIWNAHVVRELPDGSTLLYIDRHLVHEVTSPQAFEGLRLAGRRVRRPDLTFATPSTRMPARSTCPCSDWGTAGRESCTSSGRSWG